MRFRNTGMMAVLVAGLAAYTFYEFKHSEEGGSDKSERRVFHLVRDDIDEISVAGKGGETVLRKSGDKWNVTKPVEDLAESSAVEGFIYSLLTQKGKEFQDGGKFEWSKYGLDPAGATVVVKGKGKTETLKVSSKNAFDGSYYIRVGDELWLGDRGLAQIVDREPKSFRSRRVYRGSEEPRTIEARLDYNGERDGYAFKKSGEKWAMDPDPGFPVDAAKVSAWVQKIMSLNGSEIVETQPTGKPSMQLKVEDWSISLSGDVADQVLATTNKNSFVFKLTPAALEQVRVPRAYFRDGRAPFKFDLELVKEVEIQSDKLKASFVKKDASWALKNPAEGQELDQDKLVQFIQAVQSLEAEEFVSGGSALPGTPQIQMRSGDGKPVFTLAWGADYKPKRAFNKGKNLRYARVTGAKELLGVAKDKLDRLLDSAMIRKKAAENKTAAAVGSEHK